MKTIYPWDKWSDGRIHRIYKDQHYIEVAALRGAAYSQGLRRGGRYTIRQEVRGVDDILLIQFVSTKDGNKQPPPPRTALPQLDIELLTKILKLVHPDRHPPERQNEATLVTQRVSALRDEIRKSQKER